MVTPQACPGFPIPETPYVKCTFCMYSENTIDRSDSKTSAIFGLLYIRFYSRSTGLGRNQVFTQSHYREVPRWEIFMEQELRLEPIGGTEKMGLGQL